METILSVPALRIFYKASCIDQGFMYASDAEVLKKAKDSYIFWRQMEDPEGLYISNKDDENSHVVKLGELDTIEACPFYNIELIQKARKTLVEIWFEKAKKVYEENLAIPAIETYMENVFLMTDYDVFLNLEYNDYFVFEQKESLTGSENVGQEILLKVDRNENN